jgi:hypothetical protein
MAKLQHSVDPLVCAIFLRLLGYYPKCVVQFIFANQRFPTLISNFPSTPVQMFVDGQHNRILSCHAFTGIPFRGTGKYFSLRYLINMNCFAFVWNFHSGVGLMSLSYEDNVTMTILVDSTLFDSSQLEGLDLIVKKDLDELVKTVVDIL